MTRKKITVVKAQWTNSTFFLTLPSDSTVKGSLQQAASSLSTALEGGIFLR